MCHYMAHVLAPFYEAEILNADTLSCSVVIIVQIDKSGEKRARGAYSRSTESATFLKRALMFQSALKRGQFPNASTLATLCRCSRSTAMRTIDRLRYEFGMPIEYDESQRGYFLTRNDFSLHELPLGYGELVALAVMCELTALIEDRSLQESAASLWAKMTQGREGLGQELERLRRCLSIDPGLGVRLCGIDLVELLTLCHRRQVVQVRYQIQSESAQDTILVGSLEKVYLFDGSLMVVLRKPSNQEVLLHASRIAQVEALSTMPDSVQDDQSKYLCDPIGYVYPGSKESTEMIEISIMAPAAQVFAMQRWHAEQEDTWDGNTLTRRFPAVITGQLAKRVLGVGRFLVSIKPPELLEQMYLDISHLWSLCKSERGGE